MPIREYQARGRRLWMVDEYIDTPTGFRRAKKRRFRTREMAQKWLAKQTVEGFEGRYLDKKKVSTLTVSEAWKLYAPVDERDNASHRSDASRAKHLLAQLGNRRVAELGQADVDAYRNVRLGQTTRRMAPPSPATLDREVELLRRVLSYAKKCGKLASNPLAGVQMLNEPNVREVTVADDALERILGALEKRSRWMEAPLLTSYDTGMRIGEVLHLRRDRIDWEAGCIRLTPQETKTKQGRVVYLQARTIEALKAAPRVVGSPWLFTGARQVKGQKPHPRTLPRRGWVKALKAAGLEGVHVHDLRRSYATVARKRGVPESVVMKQGGWRTPAVFRRYNIVDEEDLKQAARTMETAREQSGSHGPTTVQVGSDHLRAREGTIL